MTQVTDFPIWDDCPFRDRVPACIEIRKGKSGEQTVLAFWWPEFEFHVDMDADKLELDDPDELSKMLEVVMGNLTGAVFNKEFPGRFAETLEARALFAVKGKKIPLHLLRPIQRLEELDKLIPRAKLSSVTQAA